LLGSGTACYGGRIVYGLISLAGVVVALAAGPGVDVRGDTTCPSAADVRAALDGLVSPAPVATSDVVELRGHDGAVSVRLVGATGEFIAEKPLPATATCPERARAAAVIVAAWETRLRAGLAGALDVPKAEPPAPPPPIAPLPSQPIAAVIRPAPSPAPATIEVAPGAAVLASMISGHVVAGALVETAFSAPSGRFGVGLGGLLVDAHTTAVGAGKGSWRRLGGVVDARSGVRAGRFELGLRAGVALTALSISGSGLPNAKSATLFDPGMLAALRARLHLGALTPWVEGAVAFWPAGHDLYVDGNGDPSATLPSAEVMLAIGLSFAPKP
jgi:hypothetical protein